MLLSDDMTEIVSTPHKSKEAEEKCPVCSRYICTSCFVTNKGVKICNDCHIKMNKNNILLPILSFVLVLVVILTIFLALFT